MKMLVRFLVILCLLFWGGHSSTYATQKDGGQAIVHAANQSDATYSNYIKASKHVQVQPNHLLKKKNKNRLNLPDDDDDDDDTDTSLKKCVKSNHCLIALHYALAPAEHCHAVRKNPSYSKHFSYYSSSKYILYGVFRV